MLSRIAESLFWIGRYIERADGTARIEAIALTNRGQFQPAPTKTAAVEPPPPPVPSR